MSAPLQLYSLATSNGVRVSTFLEELKAAYGLQYEYAPPPACSRTALTLRRVTKVDITKNTQKEPWYIAINPNGRMCVALRLYARKPASDRSDRRRSPALVDPNRGGFQVFESAAILLYLVQHYDGARKFAFDPATQPDEYSEMLQWMFFAHGGIGRKWLVARM
jgi:glutathione S-transferase